jgi:DNA transformation protein
VSASAEFIEFLKDQMAGFGSVNIRRMFGGAGIYHNGLMFALVADDVLYLKADETTRQDFETEGLTPFTYDAKRGKNVIMSYWRAPVRCLDDPLEMTIWAKKAYSTAVKARRPKSSRRC